MTEALPPDEDLAALFRAEQAEHVFSDALRATVLRGVESAVLLGPGVAVGGSGAAMVAKAWTTKMVVLLAAGTFVFGATVATIATRALAPVIAPQAVTPPLATPAPTAIVAPPPEAPPSANAPPVVSATEGARPRPPAASAESVPSTLAREGEIIEMGRAALARGRPADALGAADEHKRMFPRGRLTEEREELAIRALRAAGRSDEANSRAALFLKAYPASIYGAP